MSGLGRIGMERRQGRGAVVAAACMVLAGCAAGPNYTKPAAPPAAALGETGARPIPGVDVRGGEAQRLVAGMDVPGQWWTLFHSEALDALIAQSLKANPDLDAAQASLRQAREVYLAARGARLPQVDLALAANREKNPGVLASPLASNANVFSLFGASVNVSYALDPFGGVRRQVEASAALVDAQRYQLEASYLTLTANLAVAAVQAAATREQIAATKNLIDGQAALLEVLRGQFARGQIARGDVAAQEQALVQARTALPPLKHQLEQQRDQIRALVGGYPADRIPDVDMASLRLPSDLPDAVPSRLVEQRPDIRAAEANLHAASANVGVAAAARLPALTLTAAAGGQSTALSDLLSASNESWNLGAGLVQPIFNGGTLAHQERAAMAALDQSRAQYRSTVVGAFQNVADALQALQSDAEAMQLAAEVEATTAAVLADAQGKFDHGEVGSTAVLTARQAHDQALISLSQARAARFVDTVALFQGLGGGWWNRTDVRAS